MKGDFVGKAKLPWFMKMALGIVSLACVSNYIGLITKTKVWCALSGKCEIGGANYADLILSSVFSTVLLIVFCRAVVCRYSGQIALLGVIQLVAAALMLLSEVTNHVTGIDRVSLIDAILLVSVTYVGCCFVLYSIQELNNGRL